MSTFTSRDVSTSIIQPRLAKNISGLTITLAHIQRGVKLDTVAQYWANVGSAS